MGKDPRQYWLPQDKVREDFNAILAQNLERLIGTKEGIGALSLNLETIACLVLLVERESEIESVQFHPPKRYTNETFLNNLAEIGLESDENLEIVLYDMIQKGYINVDSIGRFFAQKPAISMVQLLDRVFPTMPGMNLIAYLVQTMDEVLSGRKDLESAISQFDQTIRMQGVSPSREKPQPEIAEKPDKGRQQPTGKTRLKLSDIYHRRQTETTPSTEPATPSEPKIVLATGRVSHVEVRDLFSAGAEPPQTVSDTDEDLEDQEFEVSEEATGPEPEEEPTELPDSVDTEGSYDEQGPFPETTQDVSPEPDSEEADSEEADLPDETIAVETASEDLPSDQEMPLPASEPVEQETGISIDTEVERHETKADQTEEAASTVEAEYETEIVSEPGETISDDKLVERQIAAFEEDLAMVCPVCLTGKVKAEQTAKGKLFYVCSNKNCVFVSWGKPYHIVCPQCRNPFLIESTERDGKTILRCPRATCRHRQGLPGETSDSPAQDRVSTSEDATKSSVISRKPRRKVVRRRLVRRKKKR
ncbi:MAG: hypothetical protein JRF30_02550 [Deltaproteobacteria bacterium]|nr:hypothetical protein [Deltaproteobacteria bacterium]MBW1793285.1 hypothetical protein [Deltaproteobacteria bacterium]MBW2329815.1 hypothetical protein [Deltaproteobacteria bacterium]